MIVCSLRTCPHDANVFPGLLDFMYIHIHTEWGKSRLMVVTETELILGLLFINYCISFHMNNCKCTFAPHCVCVYIYTHTHTHIIPIYTYLLICIHIYTYL